MAKQPEKSEQSKQKDFLRFALGGVALIGAGIVGLDLLHNFFGRFRGH